MYNILFYEFTCLPLLAVFINQIQPPIESQKEEKLAILITYAFTINHYFAGHKHKNME
jgi:hypothetical protein